MHTVEIKTVYGIVKATWQREGRMIIVRYGDRMKSAQASEADAANDLVVRSILSGWIATDMKTDA